MKVKLFDFEHEQDLEKAVNKFLTDGKIKVKTFNIRPVIFL